MTRYQLIEQILRAVYGDQPRDDSVITPNLVNQYINQALAVAVKNQYKESLQIDGVSYINNSFYSTFKNLAIVQEQNLLWKVKLPSVPIAIGRNEGVANMRLVDAQGREGLDAIPLSINQKGYHYEMRRIPNRMLYYYEGDYLFILSSLLLNTYKANITMISGGGSGSGSSADLNTELSAPDDFIAFIVEYVVKALMLTRQSPKDNTNDGVSN
jgi:hypothetical protein